MSDFRGQAAMAVNKDMFTLVIRGGYPVMVVTDEIDSVVGSEFRRALFDLLAGRGTPVYLDMTGVTFFDSTGINILIHAQQTADCEGVHMVLDASPIVVRVLTLLGLDCTFTWGPCPTNEMLVSAGGST